MTDYDDRDGGRYGYDERDYQRFARRKPFYRRPGLLVALGVGVVALALVAAFLLNGFIKWPNEQVDRESALTGAYTQLEQADSTFVRSIESRFNLAQDKANKVVEVVRAAAADTAGTGKTVDSRGFAVVLQQVMPDLGSLNLYDDIGREITVGQARYYDVVSGVVEQANLYRAWIHKFPQKWFVGSATDQLRADGLMGDAALNHIINPPVSQSTRDAFNSGTFKPVIPGPSAAQPSPTGSR